MSNRRLNTKTRRHEVHEGALGSKRLNEFKPSFWKKKMVRERKCATQRVALSGLRVLRDFVFNPPVILLRLVIPPQPPQRVRQNRSAVFAAVFAGAPDGFVVVLGELQGGFHLLIREK